MNMGRLSAFEEAKVRYPQLAAVMDLWREIYAIQVEAAGFPTVSIQTEAIRHRLAEGKPALSWEDLAWDREVFERMLQGIVEVVERRQPGWSGGLKEMLPEFFADRWPEVIGRWWVGEDLADERMAFLVTAVLAPALHRVAETMRPLVDEVEWYRGFCPVCGGAPDYAVLERENGVRRLFCSRCDTGWRFPRLRCPFCENEDPEHLAYYPAEGQPYRLYVCESCRHYLKTMDLRESARPFNLAAERMGTLWLDAVAREMGYG